MASEGLEFNEVAILVRGALNSGRLKLQRSGVVFKASKTGKIDHINKDDIESAHWLRVARGQELKIVLKSGSQFRFDGFRESDYSNLSEFLSQFYDVKIENMELSVKGWNWGTAKFKGSALSFEVDKKQAFEIPLKDVSQATTAGDNEVTLEFHQHDDAEVSLMEMRFYIPTSADNSDPHPVKTFHEHVISKADIIQVTGDAIVTIPDIACLTPRGRYTVKVFPAFLQLHGKTYDYKIPYTTILRLFLLPHKDQRFMFFVVSMDPPIKQGQTRYPFLITQFDKQEEFDVKLNITDDEIKEKFEGKISQEMSGPIYEIVSRLMKAVVGKKITVPGTFKSHTGTSCMTCSFRAGSGLLYPLERGFIFVHKPPIHVRFDEIACVNFARVSGGGSASRSFDFEVETKNGSKFVFSSIEREEYSRLFDFVNAKKLRIKNTGKMKSNKKDNNYDEDIFNSDDEATHDAYLEQVKAEAADRDSEDSEDEDSDDESFAPDEGDSDQDVKEEFDSEASSSSDEDDSGSGSDDEKSKKKEKKEKEKKRKAEKQKTPKRTKSKKTDVGESSAKKRRSKKDPNAPKRAMSAYMLWLGEERQKIKDENPGISLTEISKVAGERWKTIGDKSKWEKLAAEEKVKYQEKMKEYKSRLSAAGPSTPPSSKKETKKKVTKKKETKKDTPKSSPRKSLEAQKTFKSAEFIESSDESDSDDDKKQKKTKQSKSKKEESEDESMEEDDASEEEMSDVGSDSD